MELPKGWAFTSVGEIAQYINGRAFKPQEWEEKGLPIIRIQNLNNDKIKYNYTTKIYEDKYKVEYGDLLFAWSASLGAYIWRSSDAWLNQHIFKVIPFEGVDRKFMFYFLTNTVEHFYSKTHGSGMVHITKSIFEDTQILLPPFPEQQRIVEKIDALFSELDKGVEILQIVKEQLKTYRQSVFKSAFEGILKKHNLVPLRKLVKVVFDGPFGSNLKTSDYTEKGVRVVRLENIQRLHFDLTKETFVTTEKYETIKRHTVRFPDIIMSTFISGEVKAILIPESLGYAINKADCVCIRTDDLIQSKFLIYYLSTKQVYDELFKMVHGATRPRVNTKQIKNILVPDCASSEQIAISAFIESRLSVCDKLEQLVDENLAKADALRQSILKKAFEGRLVPQDPNDEPAEKLLERIKAERAAAEQRTKRQKSVKRSKKNG